MKMNAGKISLRFIKNIRYLSSNSSIDQNEIVLFNKLSADWWNETGAFKPLHSFNKIRIPFIRESLVQNGSVKKELINTSNVLKDLYILDVGCGGGLLSEPLSKLGAKVTGLDADTQAVEVAKKHSTESCLENVSYVASSIEDHVVGNKGKYDAVVASEILEHVSNRENFLKMCVECLKPGGSIIITTMNKTLLADILGIRIAECIKLVPRGTHQIEKFTEPHEVQRILEKYKCQTTLVHGFRYSVLTNKWSFSSDTSINYGLSALKLE
ncbi:ubiquinone biosynthesis O-methyltransferase [Coccinella septempunctata]|uniref:ubiquinone biosynthesis O-methyltransferase n=1 Tax=Coccinella septempunctata TaxID=41139 RepID=UPI001D082FA0|nr:ubiquinone biosynthesis O-methyltransferase [Coccinella septempunctata]